MSMRFLRDLCNSGSQVHEKVSQLYIIITYINHTRIIVNSIIGHKLMI